MREPPRISPGKRRETEAVRTIAGAQEGVVGRAQLLEAGISGSTIDRAGRSGRLHRLHRGVYSTLAPELIREDGLLIAALLAAGDGAVLSHGTAAWRWHIIPAPPPAIELAVPRPRTAPSGITFFQSRLRAEDRTFKAGFPSTSVVRTLLDLATRYQNDALLRA